MLLAFAVCFSSCDQHRIRDYILDYYSGGKNETQILVLDFSEILEVAYTEYYFIGDLQLAGDISDITGHPYHGRILEDWQHRLIFFNGDKEVYEETFGYELLSNIHTVVNPNPKLAVRIKDGTPYFESQ